LINVQQLFLENNQLTGVIPAEMGNLNSVAQINLRNNKLTGSIPSTFSDHLGLIYVHGNCLTNFESLIDFNGLFGADAQNNNCEFKGLNWLMLLLD